MLAVAHHHPTKMEMEGRWELRPVRMLHQHSVRQVQEMGRTHRRVLMRGQLILYHLAVGEGSAVRQWVEIPRMVPQVETMVGRGAVVHSLEKERTQRWVQQTLIGAPAMVMREAEVEEAP